MARWFTTPLDGLVAGRAWAGGPLGEDAKPRILARIGVRFGGWFRGVPGQGCL